jgi:hypothetical protein
MFLFQRLGYYMAGFIRETLVEINWSAELPIVLSSKSHIIWPKSAQKGAHPF